MACLMSCGSVLAKEWASKEISVTTKDGIVLGATLTYPADSKPLAAIAMATGSGTQNRDEEVFGHKPFKALAENLSEAGYAVLRVDDRGYDDPEQAKSATNDIFVDDARCALGVLDSIYDRSIKKGVIGHSEGGLTAIKLAADSAVDFIVTLAAPAWRGDSIVMSQSRVAAMAATGRWDAENGQRQLLDIAMGTGSDFFRRSAIRSVINSQLGASASLPQVQAIVTKQIESLMSPWYRDFLNTNPANYIPKVRIPWLALNGEKDMQVLAENLKTINELNPSADTRLIPSLNHLFLECTSGLPSEYPTLTGDIDPGVIKLITEWMNNLK